MSVAAVIPALNEEMWIGASIDAARAAGIDEVIVSDGGSSDATISIATGRGARVIVDEQRGERMRARQLNRGAEAASSDALVFVHADTLLPLGAARAIKQALHHFIFGGFRLTFAEREQKLRIAETMINVRTAMTKSPWGDQAQFILRKPFLRNGGFREIPIMEDYELAVRMKRSGPTTVLPLHVITSGRRFLEMGVWKTAALNWRIIASYRLGADPDDLAKLYRG
jgi:rSAM/selenodomain-associated transferase 2